MSAANPAVNIIAPHEKKEYLGFSFLPPRTILPYLDEAIKIDSKNTPSPMIK